jgi:hypothetical protein
MPRIAAGSEHRAGEGQHGKDGAHARHGGGAGRDARGVDEARAGARPEAHVAEALGDALREELGVVAGDVGRVRDLERFAGRHGEHEHHERGAALAEAVPREEREQAERAGEAWIRPRSAGEGGARAAHHTSDATSSGRARARCAARRGRE